MDNIHHLMSSYIADGDNTTNKLLGASLIVVDADGTLHESASGRLSSTAGSPAMTLESSGWIASMSKIVTATALMQIVERGLIQLDDDVRPLVPELAAVQILQPIQDDAKVTLRDNTNAITLRQLLTHTSGMSYDAADPDLIKWSESVGRTARTLSQTREGWNTPLRFPPGAAWLYGSGIDWAGLVLEKVTGLKLGQYMASNIFHPLRMKDTTFCRKEIADRLSDRILECCYRTLEGSLVAGPLPVPEDPAEHSGGAGLFSTAKDISLLLQALLAASQGQGGIIGKESVEEMLRPQLSEAQAQSMWALVKDILPFPSDTAMNHGISGVINLENVEGKRRKGTMTWGGMTNPHWWIDCEAGIAAVIFVHLLPQGDKATMELYDKLERAVYEHR